MFSNAAVSDIRGFAVCTGGAFTLLLVLVVGLAIARPVAAEAEGAVDALVAEGLDHLAGGDERAAIRAFEKADRQADGGSIEARLALARTFSAMGAEKKVVEAARRALEIARRPEARVAAHTYLGFALAEQAIHARRPEDDLRGAESAFRAALELTGDGDEKATRTLLLNLGIVLLRLEEDRMGTETLERFLAMAPGGAEAARARFLIDDPRRARKARLPQFELVTLDGDYLTEEDLEGKVVVLDFWATWCQPCHQSIPALEDLHWMAEKGEPVVVIGISGDAEESTMRRFLAERNTGWIQVWEGREPGLHSALSVTGYPTFVVADHEGKIVARHSGWSEVIGYSVREAVQRSVRAARKAARRQGE